MKKVIYLGLIGLVACSGDENDEQKLESSGDEVVEMTNPETVDASVQPDRNVYVDENIASDKELVFRTIVNEDSEEEEAIFVQEGSQFYPVEMYEGTLMKASGAAAGFSLRFAPYSYWDEALEMEVKSHFDEVININLTKNQNSKLGFVDYTDATENIAWDYFENLFIVYYYTREETNFPLKFIDLGKTEWDG